MTVTNLGPGEHEALLARLLAEPNQFMADVAAGVAGVGWGVNGSVAHVPDPLFAMRRLHVSPEQTVLHRGDPRADRDDLDQLTRYGLDRHGRIICGQAWRDGGFVQHRDPAGTVLWTASAGHQNGKHRILELTTYGYAGGRMVTSRQSSRVTPAPGGTDRYRWFRYDDRGQLVLVIWVDKFAGDRPAHARAQRLTWDADELVRVTETYGSADVEDRADPDEQLAVLERWEAAGGMPRETVYDARIDRRETTMPPAAEVETDLHLRAADAICAAVAAAVSDGRVEHPFYMSLRAELPPIVHLVDQRARERRRTLPQQTLEFRFPEEVELDVLAAADEETLRRFRQAMQGGFQDGWKAQARYARELQFELNRRRYPGATDDFIARVHSSFEPREFAWLTEQFGAGRVSAFRASVGPDDSFELPDPPERLASDDDVRQLLRACAVPERFVAEIASRAEWGLRLVSGDGASHLGGHPELPAEVAWPRYEDQPMDFIAHLQLAELPSIPGRERLPADGALLFFFAIDTEGYFGPVDTAPGDPARVIYVPAGSATAPAEPPAGLVPLGEQRLHMVPRLTLASTWPLAHELGLDHYEQEAYTWAVNEAQGFDDEHGSQRTHDQVLGHPVFVQRDPREGPEHAGWIVLLAVNDNQAIGLHLADGGALGYIIAPDALERRAWETVHVAAESC